MGNWAFALFLMLMSGGVLNAQTADSTPIDISSSLGAIAARTKIPGLAAIVLRGDRIVAEGVAGVRKNGSPELITLHDQFQLNSGTKAMTATLAAIAVENGKLSWNTTLGDVFSSKVKKMKPAWKSVTLEQLLDHRGGVPNEMSKIGPLLRIYCAKVPPPEQRRMLAKMLLSGSPAYTPGSKFVYSSLGYILVGVMLETATGRTWEDLMREQLWQPLGITTGGFGAPGTPGKVDEPWGHWGGLIAGHPVPPWGFWARLNPPLFWGPGGNSYMTITDWAKFVAMHLRGDAADPLHETHLFTAESFQTLHRTVPGKFYESGWILATRSWANGHRPGDTGRVLSSQGDNYFWHAEAWIAPEIDFAILVVVNEGGATADKPAFKASEEVVDTLAGEFANLNTTQRR